MTHSHECAKKVVHYICAKCPDTSKLGAIKMNKTLLYADRCSYLHTGKTITGLQYIKQRYGPVPQHITTIFREMEAEGLIQTSREYPGGSGMAGAWLFQSRKEPDKKGWTDLEITILDGVIQDIRDNHTASSISEASHDWAWELAEDGEVIPIGTCLIGDAVKPNSHDMEWANDVLSRPR